MTPCAQPSPCVNLGEARYVVRPDQVPFGNKASRVQRNNFGACPLKLTRDRLADQKNSPPSPNDRSR